MHDPDVQCIPKYHNFFNQFQRGELENQRNQRRTRETRTRETRTRETRGELEKLEENQRTRETRGELEKLEQEKLENQRNRSIAMYPMSRNSLNYKKLEEMD